MQRSLGHSKKQRHWYEKLLPEQKEVVDFILPKEGVALFSQQGTGKTWISTAVLEQLIADGSKLFLIVAPLTSLDITWEPALKTLDAALLRDEQRPAVARQAQILLIHWELFVKHAKKLSKIAWDLVLIDESQRIKARNNRSSRAARRFRFAKRRLALSGTPIDESQIDIWGQMRFIDCTVFGENWGNFSGEYCYKTGFMGKQWVFDLRKQDRFLKALENHVIRLTIDIMDLEPLTVFKVPVRMFGKQDKLYRHLDEHSIVTIDGERIKCPLTITKRRKLEQITGGAVLTDEGGIVDAGEAKQRKLAWLVGKLSKPIVVFCLFRHEIELIEEVLKRSMKRVALLHGGVKKQRTQLNKDFQAGKYDAIICQTKTGSVSIPFTRSCRLILYSHNDSYIDFEQTIFRVHRGGQLKAVSAYILFCEDTVDEEKLNIVEGKSKVAFSVMSHFQQEPDMAKKAKKAVKKPSKKAAAKGAKQAKAANTREQNLPAFGVPELAKHMDLEPATLRVKLRDAKVKKSGKSYGWDTKAAMVKVANQLSA